MKKNHNNDKLYVNKTKNIMSKVTVNKPSKKDLKDDEPKETKPKKETKVVDSDSEEDHKEVKPVPKESKSKKETKKNDTDDDDEPKKEAKPEKESKATKEKETKSTKEKETKTSKEDVKSTKEESKETSSKKEGVNANTTRAGLIFDVNTRKRWLKTYLSADKYLIDQMTTEENDDGKKVRQIAKDDDGDDKKCTLNISGAQYALSAVEQVLCAAVVTVAFPKATKSKSGLHELTLSVLLDSVRSDLELNSVLGQYLALYDSSADYFSQLKVTKQDEIRAYVETRCLDNTTVRLTNDGFNFLCFVLQRNRIVLTNFTHRLVTFAKKRTMSEDAIMAAVEFLYERSPGLLGKMTKKYEEVSLLIEEAVKVEKAEKEKKQKEKEKEAKADSKADKKSTKAKKKTDDSDSD